MSRYAHIRQSGISGHLVSIVDSWILPRAHQVQGIAALEVGDTTLSHRTGGNNCY